MLLVWKVPEELIKLNINHFYLHICSSAEHASDGEGWWDEASSVSGASW